MPRFILRDLFWLTLVVGLALGWWVHHSNQDAAHKAALDKAYAWRRRAGALETLMRDSGWQVKWDFSLDRVYAERFGRRKYVEAKDSNPSADPSDGTIDDELNRMGNMRFGGE